MFKELQVAFSEHTKIFSKNSKSLIANIRTGNCIFLSNEIVGIYKRAEEKNYHLTSFFHVLKKVIQENYS